MLTYIETIFTEQSFLIDGRVSFLAFVYFWGVETKKTKNILIENSSGKCKLNFICPKYHSFFYLLCLSIIFWNLSPDLTVVSLSESPQQQIW